MHRDDITVIIFWNPRPGRQQQQDATQRGLSWPDSVYQLHYPSLVIGFVDMSFFDYGLGDFGSTAEELR